VSEAPLLDSPAGSQIADELCSEFGVERSLIEALITAVQSQAGKVRRRGLFDQFDGLLADPRPEE
jgi:hypothetical protein